MPTGKQRGRSGTAASTKRPSATKGNAAPRIPKKKSKQNAAPTADSTLVQAIAAVLSHENVNSDRRSEEYQQLLERLQTPMHLENLNSEELADALVEISKPYNYGTVDEALEATAPHLDEKGTAAVLRMLGFNHDGTERAGLRPARQALEDAQRGDDRSGQKDGGKRRRDDDDSSGADKRVRFEEAHDDVGYDTEVSGADDQGYSTDEADTAVQMCAQCGLQPAKGRNANGGFNRYCSGTCFGIARRGAAAEAGGERRAQSGGVRGRAAGSGGRTAGAHAGPVERDGDSMTKLDDGQKAALLIGRSLQGTLSVDTPEYRKIKNNLDNLQFEHGPTSKLVKAVDPVGKVIDALEALLLAVVADPSTGSDGLGKDVVHRMMDSIKTQLECHFRQVLQYQDSVEFRREVQRLWATKLLHKLSTMRTSGLPKHTDTIGSIATQMVHCDEVRKKLNSTGQQPRQGQQQQQQDGQPRGRQFQPAAQYGNYGQRHSYAAHQQYQQMPQPFPPMQHPPQHQQQQPPFQQQFQPLPRPPAAAPLPGGRPQFQTPELGRFPPSHQCAGLKNATKLTVNPDGSVVREFGCHACGMLNPPQQHTAHNCPAPQDKKDAWESPASTRWNGQ
jgi:hypothetical protein